LLATEYISKWIEIVPTRTNNAKVATKFEKIIYWTIEVRAKNFPDPHFVINIF